MVNDGRSGRGRLLLDPAKQHDDLRLLRMAVRKRWDIPEEFRVIAIERLQKIVEGDDDEIAMKAIAEARHMESQNQKDEHKIVDVQAQREHDRLDVIASELGIDQGLIESVAREAGGSDSGDAIKDPKPAKKRAGQGRRKKARATKRSRKN